MPSLNRFYQKSKLDIITLVPPVLCALKINLVSSHIHALSKNRTPNSPRVFIKSINNRICQSLDDDTSLHFRSAKESSQTKSDRQTGLETHFINRSNRKRCSFTGRRLIYPNRRWNGPNKQIHDWVCHHLVGNLHQVSPGSIQMIANSIPSQLSARDGLNVPVSTS